MSRTFLLRLAAAMAIGIVAFVLGRGTAPVPSSPDGGAATTATAEPTLWTCSMHPSIQLPEPGDCPICGMDLIPLEEDSGQEEVRLSMSKAARKLAEIQTTPVRREFPEMELRMVGKIDYDETRQRKITAWVGGRLERLYVDYEGISIREGDHMVELYSPDLVSAQEELLQAHRSVQSAGREGNALLRDSAQLNFDAARDKLRLLGLDAGQIDRIIDAGQVRDVIELRAPIDGVVIEKHALEGAYVQTGSPIYTIADLTHLWVEMEAYESDLVWLRYGQKITFTTEALPGRRFEGTISFIAPVLDSTTRTANVRVNVENTERELKPGMFVRAVVHPRVAGPGHVVAADLRGKWISPMHPEVIKDGPGSCDVCGMDLVPIEEVGYQPMDPDQRPPLVIPASAPLITGKRAVVYVAVPDADRPTYEGREVVLGPRATDQYVVESGLREGEEVVTRGAFKIDSAMQIQAKPSMMLPAEVRPGAGRDPHEGHEHGPVVGEDGHVGSGEPLDSPATLRVQLGALAEAAMELSQALAASDTDAARAARDAVVERFEGIEMDGLEDEIHAEWMRRRQPLGDAVERIASASDLEALRAALPQLTEHLAGVIRRLGATTDGPVRRVHCPMAFDGEGADWLQSGSDVANPYYGAAMLRCGSVVEELVEEEGQP